MRWIVSRLVLSASVAVVGCASLGGGSAAAAASATVSSPPAPTASAPGSPGSESYFDLARKDCVGTAMNRTSKVWFTVADGVLSDTYWPTIDATNVNSLQYLVTDGHSFTDLQTRDMTYRVEPDPTGMTCTIVASSSAHHYQIATTYLADPARDAVLMHVHFQGPRGDRLYVRLDPLAGGTGGGGSQNAGGNSASLVSSGHQTIPVDANTNTATDAVNRSYAVPTYMALESSSEFSSESVGYAGTASDGLTMLDSRHALTPYGSASDGHVTFTAELPTQVEGRQGANLALGFGTTQAKALSVAGASVNQVFPRVLGAYDRQWSRYDAGLRRPSSRLGKAAIAEYYESVNVVRASVDKTFPGAIVAGLASPWGQSVPAGNLTDGAPTYFGSYREVFSRDLYEAFTALLVAGDVSTARAATRFLFDRQQQADGSMPRNSLLNGEAAPDTGGLQLDETSYPILMDWQSGLAHDRTLYTQHVVPAADFLVAHGPSDGVERWEEQSGYSPSTIAAEIAGLTAAANIARVNHDPVRAAVYQATADDFARNIKAWTVTTNGPFISPTVPSYFIRIAKSGDPNSADQVDLGNGSITVDQRSLIDAGFLELVRLGILPSNDPTVQSSLTVVHDTIERQTPNGPGFYRYGTSPTESVDGYGDCFQPSGSSCSVIGAPWAPTDTGTGHLWPVLSGERGEYDVAAGQKGSALTLLTAMRKMTSGQGLEPEQVWEDPAVPASPFGTDPATASIGFGPGRPAGSASPLTWAQAQYARLALDISAGRALETPGIVTARYVTNGMPGALPVTITSPAGGASVNAASVTVTGTTSPGATVDAEGVGATGGTAATASTTAGGTGNWSLRLPTGFGSTTVTVTATSGPNTGYAQISVTNVALPGTQVLNVSDPVGDDNGPGTYQYPTASDFAPGGFDLTGLQVNETGTDVYVQASIRNLVSTFGNSFGAQLLDLYVRNPAATSTSTAAAYPQLNYTIASADAWSERLEAQGFAPTIWVNAAGASLGSVQQVVDDPSGTITLIVPQSVFGTVGSGWVFTLALAGQNGFNSYQARDFTATAGAYTFGVCAPDGTSPICSFNPSTVPYVIDTITAPGVSQATELNPTLGPVELSGVTAP
ncbi:MAG TPA: glucodextranase DOMON-like domain-containing protein [Solirubrobacteraceae bacterium]|jgi:glucoamylase|nr:glucodextranase DOMON-like domain-containing protein [Solirubrobacteraceae bacterium]